MSAEGRGRTNELGTVPGFWEMQGMERQRAWAPSMCLFYLLLNFLCFHTCQMTVRLKEVGGGRGGGRNAQDPSQHLHRDAAQ